eukprot:SAG31_NODE_755_length_12319_cov_6.335542_8_plen_99_part_00
MIQWSLVLCDTVVRGTLCQVGDETLMFGWGSQYTHGGYQGMTQPPCRGSSAPVRLLLTVPYVSDIATEAHIYCIYVLYTPDYSTHICCTSVLQLLLAA